MSDTALLLICMFVPILLGVPVAFSIGLGVMGVMVLGSSIPINMFFSTMYAACDSFPLLAVPFFVLAGDIMARCGISKRLVNLARAFVGNTTGGMGMVTILACMFFAAISGSGLATAAAIGGMMIPIMREEKYSAPYAAALTSSASAIGPIIPPSVPFIIYGVLCSVSVTDLFMAGVLPGILMGLCLMVANYIICKRTGYGADTKHESYSFKQKMKALWDAKWSVLVPVIVLGGIYGGVFTPTEAAIVATAYSLVIGFFVYREIRIKDIPAMVKGASISVGLSMALLSFATVFGRILVLEQIPATMAAAIQSATNSKVVVLLLVNALLLLAGMFLETIAAITIVGPILVAITTPYGITPLHLGIIMCVNLAIGLSTPPVGASLFVSASVAKVPLEKTFKPLIPLLVTSIIGLLIITYVPALSEWLPSILGK